MNEELPALIEGLRDNTRLAEQKFGALTGTQLNWKPAVDAWSVAQCLEHLIKIQGGYFPNLERIARDGYHPTVYQRMPLLPRMFGALVLNAVKPTTTRKSKAASKFEPSTSAIAPDIVIRFADHQQRMEQAMRSVSGQDIASTVITSPVAPIAIYSLLDAFRITVAHGRRHLAQAERVMADTRFPK